MPAPAADRTEEVPAVHTGVKVKVEVEVEVEVKVRVVGVMKCASKSPDNACCKRRVATASKPRRYQPPTQLTPLCQMYMYICTW